MTVQIPRLPQVLVRAGIDHLDPDLLCLALTHASRNRKINNERLEFLGDRVIGLALADALYNGYPDETEGDLALRHARLARADQLVKIARAHDLGHDLIVAGGAANPSQLDNVLADALEALIGAVYLDQGYTPAAQVVISLWGEALQSTAAPPRDPKTVVQEWAQGRGLPLPDYQLVERSGPDHAPQFTIELRIKGLSPAQGTGATRRLAEKNAAEMMMKELPL